MSLRLLGLKSWKINQLLKFRDNWLSWSLVIMIILLLIMICRCTHRFIYKALRLSCHKIRQFLLSFIFFNFLLFVYLNFCIFQLIFSSSTFRLASTLFSTFTPAEFFYFIFRFLFFLLVNFILLWFFSFYWFFTFGRFFHFLRIFGLKNFIFKKMAYLLYPSGCNLIWIG